MIEIRFTKKEDLNQLPWLYKQNYYGESNDQTNYDGMLRKFEELKNNEAYKFVSAMDGDKLVGFCSVIINQNIVEEQKPLITIWNLRVHPEYRRQKIGTKIMSFIEEYGKAQGVELVFFGCDAKNRKGRKFYKKLGYDEVFGFCKYL